MHKPSKQPPHREKIFKQGDMVEIRFNKSPWARCKVEVVSDNQNSLALRLIEDESLPWVNGFIHTGAAYRMFLLIRQGGRYYDVGSGNEFEIRPVPHEKKT